VVFKSLLSDKPAPVPKTTKIGLNFRKTSNEKSVNLVSPPKLYIFYVLFVAQSAQRWATDWKAGVEFPAGATVFFLSSPQRLDRPWDPPSLLSDRYRWLFPRGKAAGV
jgi:hypothetical protein